MASVSEWLAELAETEIAEAAEAPNGERLLLKSLLESATVMDESVKKSTKYNYFLHGNFDEKKLFVVFFFTAGQKI